MEAVRQVEEQCDGPVDASRCSHHVSARDGGMAITPADRAVGHMLLELCNLGVIEEAEVRRRLQASGARSTCLSTGFMSVKKSRHFVYEYDIYMFFYFYFVYEYEIYTKTTVSSVKSPLTLP